MNNFCTNCGAELQGKTKCDVCGKEVGTAIVQENVIPVETPKSNMFKKICLALAAIILLIICVKGCFGGGIGSMPNGTLTNLTDDYLISYTSERVINVEDYSNNFKKKLKGTDDTIGEAVKYLAQNKVEARIFSKNPVQFSDTRIIDADGEGRYIVAMLVKSGAFHNAYLARIDLDAKTTMYRSKVLMHGENSYTGTLGMTLQEIYEGFIDEDWGTKLSIEKE